MFTTLESRECLRIESISWTSNDPYRKGFIGRPETNAVVKYLEWKNLKYEITEVVNAHTTFVDGLPGIKIGDFEMSGASEIISILESVCNFDGELSFSEVYDRYPKTKMFQHGAGKELYSKVEMLNKYRIQFPDYPDQAVKGKSSKYYNCNILNHLHNENAL